MIYFPNAKINIGLRITERRPDGYHNIESLMVPVAWYDVLEIVLSKPGKENFTLTGSTLGGCPPEKNLVIKALRAFEAHTGVKLPPYDIHLHKVIPDGAGLGGGSSDAAIALISANRSSGLNLSDDELAEIALTVGADCPFFIYNRPMIARGKGELLTDVDASFLKGIYVAIAKPKADAVATKDAYAGVTPAPLPAGCRLEDAIAKPIKEWMADGILVNDFGPSVMGLRPQIRCTLEHIRRAGALYSAMTGSGAAVYGLFPDVKMAEAAVAGLTDCECFSGPFVI